MAVPYIGHRTTTYGFYGRVPPRTSYYPTYYMSPQPRGSSFFGPTQPESAYPEAYIHSTNSRRYPQTRYPSRPTYDDSRTPRTADGNPYVRTDIVDHNKKSVPPRPQKLRAATRKDTKKHGIPSGYSLKEWDPDEPPILLFGSVFDADSLGKWIFDWAHYCSRRGDGFISDSDADTAGELWIGLLGAQGSIQSLEELSETAKAVEQASYQELISRGGKLMERFEILLRECEGPALTAFYIGPQVSIQAEAELFIQNLFDYHVNRYKTAQLIQDMKQFSSDFIQYRDRVSAYSLGYWIFDQVCAHYGKGTPMALIAGEFWDHLIKLPHNIQSLEKEILENSESVNSECSDLLRAGKHLVERLNTLLDNNGIQPDIRTLFDHDKQLKSTEQFIQDMRCFSYQCEQLPRAGGPYYHFTYRVPGY
jgi:hypothetical protein